MKTPELIYHERINLGDYASAGTITREGDVLVTAGGHDPFMMISRDSGTTFEIKKGINYPTTYGFTQLRDGTFISFGSNNVGHRALMDKRQKVVPFVLKIMRAKTFDDILDGRIDVSFAVVDIPDLTFGWGDSNNCHSGTVAQGCVELENGDIVVTMYGQKTTDTTLCPYFVEQGYNFYLYSTWCIISRDSGKTFSYLSSIADVQTYPIPDVNAEGYCETDIFAFGGGHIVAVLRTGGHEVYSPLYASHSYDNGETWGVPYEINSWGVLPKLFRLSDGRLVLVSGHIHTFLMFSEDEGVTWSEPFIVEECDGKWGNSPSGYNTAFESAPGEITIIYDDPKEGIAEGKPYGYVRHVYMRKYRI